MATATEWQTRKDEAEGALHKLMLGSAEEEVVMADGSRVRITPVNLNQLQSYINFCEQKVEEAQRGYRRPIYFVGGR